MVCTTRAEADRAVTAIAAAGSGVVVKEDGLAAGKGVTVLDPGADASARCSTALYARGAGARIVVEERLYGPEASVIAVCDGSERDRAARARATTSAWATATRARTPAGWAPTARCPI